MISSGPSRTSTRGGASWGKVTAKTRGGNRNDPHILNYFDSDVLATGDRPWSPYLHVLAAGCFPGRNRRAPRGEVGDLRFPNVSGLDLSFRKTFRAGSRTFAPRIDIFNATNESTVTARVTQLGGTYGRVSGIQRARLIKVGLNVEF